VNKLKEAHLTILNFLFTSKLCIFLFIYFAQ
jgi:hypothetical protein